MPLFTQYRHGFTTGTPAGVNSHPRAKREVIDGWSKGSTRRLVRFFYRIDERTLTGYGFALSLTVKDCPLTASAWAKVRQAFFMRLRRLGMHRAFWLTEWQRRGVPHMHGVVFLPAANNWEAALLRSTISEHWLAAAATFNPGQNSQHVSHLVDAAGWFKYLSKHSARGQGNYQRAKSSIPSGWLKTGRMWGYLGQWTLQEPVRFSTSRECNFAVRRIVQRWRVAEARASGNLARLRSARRMLQCNDRAKGSCRGTSEYGDWPLSGEILRYLSEAGHVIQC